jgi:hypothetical protein
VAPADLSKRPTKGCALCGRHGLFLSIGKDHLCDKCRPGVTMEVNSRLRVINESVKLAAESKNYKTRLSRCTVAMSNLRHLKERFEDRGIITATPQPPSQLLMGLEHEFELLLAGAADEITDEAQRKAETVATTTAKVNAYGKAALNLADLQKEYGPNPSLDRAGMHMREAIDFVKVSATMEEAQKAEFKGNKAKALERYQEALYLALHGKTDHLPNDLMATLQTKITQLGGQVPPGLSSADSD